MLRISQTPATHPATLTLEGEISGRWVPELRRECARVLDGSGGGLVLDLAGVSSIDVAGLALIRELRARRVRVRGCSLYVAALLEGVVDIDR